MILLTIVIMALAGFSGWAAVKLVFGSGNAAMTSGSIIMAFLTTLAVFAASAGLCYFIYSRISSWIDEKNREAFEKEEKAEAEEKAKADAKIANDRIRDMAGRICGLEDASRAVNTELKDIASALSLIGEKLDSLPPEIESFGNQISDLMAKAEILEQEQKSRKQQVAASTESGYAKQDITGHEQKGTQPEASGEKAFLINPRTFRPKKRLRAYDIFKDGLLRVFIITDSRSCREEDREYLVGMLSEAIKRDTDAEIRFQDAYSWKNTKSFSEITWLLKRIQRAGCLFPFQLKKMFPNDEIFSIPEEPNWKAYGIASPCLIAYLPEDRENGSIEIFPSIKAFLSRFKGDGKEYRIASIYAGCLPYEEDKEKSN